MAKNIIVVTSYGCGDNIEKIAVSTFTSDSYRDTDNAKTYCRMTNSLELKDSRWVYAQIINENTPFSVIELKPLQGFKEAILSLDDRALQKVLRELDKYDLLKALKGMKDDALDKVYKNVSVRHKKVIQEDLEYIGSVREKDIIDSQERILSVIRHLTDTGEICLSMAEKDALLHGI